MTDRRTASISSRKRPKQARSTELVAAVLDAAVQVLAEEGAPRFTTARVAERAGVSVGSLYQYFPNKAALLFQLQADEWRQTVDLMRATLAADGRPPAERLRALVRAFIRSECEEARIRLALNDAAPFYRHAPEAADAKAAGDAIVHDFMREVLPGAAPAQRDIAAELITATMSEVGRRFSEAPRSAAEIATFSDAMADMFCTYLDNLSAA